MHLKAAREFGAGANLTSGAALVTVPDIVPPIPLSFGQSKSTKRKATSTVSKPPQTETETELPSKDPKVTGEASANPAAPLAPGKSTGVEKAEIPADTENPFQEGAVGGPEPQTGAADSTDKSGMLKHVYCN